jgi:hypothetical protein
VNPNDGFETLDGFLLLFSEVEQPVGRELSVENLCWTLPYVHAVGLGSGFSLTPSLSH